MSLKFAATGSTNNTPSLVQGMASHWIGAKLKSKSMMTKFTDTYMPHHPSTYQLYQYGIVMKLIYFTRKVVNFSIISMVKNIIRDYFVNTSSQWGTMSHCNVVSHWLSAYTNWSLHNGGNPGKTGQQPSITVELTTTLDQTHWCSLRKSGYFLHKISIKMIL